MRTMIFALAMGLATAALADPRPQDTEVYKPVPPVVTPAAHDGDPPSDAVVLFDGRSLDAWVNTNDHKPAGWTLDGGVMTVNKPVGDIETKQSFLDYQLHLEWREPVNITGSGQYRGNSGVFLSAPAGAPGYELQIVDSYKNDTYVNGSAASIYKQSIPLANAMRKPGEWQTYDVIWMAPRFRADGLLARPAHVTVFHNGVLVQNDFVLKGFTLNTGLPYWTAHAAAPIRLQAHGDPSPPISFRNIWLRPIGPEMGGLGDQP
jgi:hypothetical protein